MSTQKKICIKTYLFTKILFYTLSAKIASLFKYLKSILIFLYELETICNFIHNFMHLNFIC